MDIITMKSFQPFKSQDKKMESPKLLSLILSKASISPKFKISKIGMVKLLDKILKKSSTTLEALWNMKKLISKHSLLKEKSQK